jgi:hypothetical protein
MPVTTVSAEFRGCQVGVTIANADDVRRLSFVLVLVVVGVAAAAMRRTQLADCALPPEPGSALNLNRPADRQRLADELAQIDAIASRFRDRIRADPAVTTGAHAQRTHATRPDRAYLYCQTVLRQELAKHDSIKLSDLPAEPTSSPLEFRSGVHASLARTGQALGSPARHP